MPLSGFCILLITGIPGLYATGVLIISCSPGGTLSNIFTYYCEGDLPLSIAMTFTSTVVSMGMMPANIWLYGRYFESDDLVIPYGKMAMSLITVTSPIIIGMLIKWKLPRFASFMTKFGVHFATVITFVCIGMEIAMFPNMFTGVPFKVYAVILLMPVIGLTLGYGLAMLLRQNKPVRKTISIECGVQNVPIALTVMALSFPLEMQEKLILLPWMYLLSMSSGCAVICLTYNFCKKCSKKTETDTHSAVKEDLLLGETENFEPTNRFKIEIKPSILTNGKPISNVDSDSEDDKVENGKNYDLA